MANLAPQTQKTTGAWSRDEVRELNNALYIALEYFNIVEGGDKWAAKAIAKRARNWSVRWYQLRQSPIPGNMVNNNPAGRNIPFIPGRILQRTVEYRPDYDLYQLNFDMWDLRKAPGARATRHVAGVNAMGTPAIASNTPAEVTFDANIRLCPVLSAGQSDQITKSRKVVALEKRFARTLRGEHVSIADLQREGIFRRLPEFIIQLGRY